MHKHAGSGAFGKVFYGMYNKEDVASEAHEPAAHP